MRQERLAVLAPTALMLMQTRLYQCRRPQRRQCRRQALQQCQRPWPQQLQMMVLCLTRAFQGPCRRMHPVCRRSQTVLLAGHRLHLLQQKLAYPTLSPQQMRPVAMALLRQPLHLRQALQLMVLCSIRALQAP